MKRLTQILISVSILLFHTHSLNANAQTLCGTVDEGQTLTLTAPSSNVFISITFASYGTPNGVCGNFTVGGCHAANSQSIVQSYLIGNNSASIPATNGTFGDPCGGTFKRLYVEAVYGTPLPLKILSFSGNVNGNTSILKWETTNEINTKQFEIERSNNGINFFGAGNVVANNGTGNNLYSFTDNLMQAGIYFYRLKIIDIDGKFSFSNIIKLSNYRDDQFHVFPNPATDLITLNGLQKKGTVQIIDLDGKILKQLIVTAQTQTVNMKDYPSGLYLIKYFFDLQTKFQKIVKL